MSGESDFDCASSNNTSNEDPVTVLPRRSRHDLHFLCCYLYDIPIASSAEKRIQYVLLGFEHSEKFLRATLNKSWRQHLTKQQLYGHLPPTMKTIKIRRNRHARHCWRSRDELISDVLLWTPSHGWAKAGRPARTYIQQLCADTRCSHEDLPKAMDDREVWWERVRNIRADSVTWWWWWWWWTVR